MSEMEIPVIDDTEIEIKKKNKLCPLRNFMECSKNCALYYDRHDAEGCSFLVIASKL